MAPTSCRQTHGAERCHTKKYSLKIFRRQSVDRQTVGSTLALLRSGHTRVGAKVEPKEWRLESQPVWHSSAPFCRLHFGAVSGLAGALDLHFIQNSLQLSEP